MRKNGKEGAARLSDAFGGLDDGLLEESLRVDDTKKLRRNKRRKAKSVSSAFFPRLCRRLAVGACVLLLGSVLVAAPFLKERLEGSDPFGSSVVDPWAGQDEGRVVINSMDKWNYYAAKKTIADAYRLSALSAEKGKGALIEAAADEAVFESAVDSSAEDIPPEDYEPPKTQTGETSSAGGGGGNDIYDLENGTIYYDMSAWGELIVIRTIYFQIRLPSGEGFLASRLGGGTVEVVVAESGVAEDMDMITFRNGDRYYSCVGLGTAYDKETFTEHYYFSAHKYIEGFYLVKNLKWEHYEFRVSVRHGEVVGFTCDYRYTGEENEAPSVAENSTYIVDKEVTYTVAELEEYFNAAFEFPPDSASEPGSGSSTLETPPADSAASSSERTETPYLVEMYSSPDHRVFALFGGGRFKLYNSNDPNVTLGEGTFEYISGGIEFIFYSGCDAAIVAVEFDEDNTFIYDGSTFYPDMLD